MKHKTIITVILQVTITTDHPLSPMKAEFDTVKAMKETFMGRNDVYVSSAQYSHSRRENT